MDALELRTALLSISLSQADLARLLQVTARAVNLWATGEREVPGPVAAYVRLLLSLPRALQVQEIARLTKKEKDSMEGIYSFAYRGIDGAGLGVMVFMGGRALGGDGGVSYDGTYEPSSDRSGHLDLKLTLTVAPGISLVMGVPPQPFEYRFDTEVTIPARTASTVSVETPLGPVIVDVRYLRGIPTEFAA